MPSRGTGSSGIFVAQFVEAEAAALGDLEGARQRFFVAAEQPRHLVRPASDGARHWRRGETRPRRSCNARGCRSAHPAAGAARARGRARRRWRRSWSPVSRGDRREAGEAARVVAAIKMVRGEIGAAGKSAATRAANVRCAARLTRSAFGRQQRRRSAPRRGPRHRRSRDGIRPSARAACRGSGAASAGHRRRGPRDRPSRLAPSRRSSRDADDEADAGFLRRLMRAHDAGEAVAVGDRDRRETERAPPVGTSSSGCEAPRRNEKLLVTCSSAYPPDGLLGTPLPPVVFARFLGNGSQTAIADRAGQPAEPGKGLGFFGRQLRHQYQAKTPWTNQRGGGSPGSPARNSQKRRPDASSTR